MFTLKIRKIGSSLAPSCPTSCCASCTSVWATSCSPSRKKTGAPDTLRSGIRRRPGGLRAHAPQVPQRISRTGQVNDFHWLNPAVIRVIHAELIAENGGVARRANENLLAATLARARHLGDRGGQPSLFEHAAAYGFGFARTSVHRWQQAYRARGHRRISASQRPHLVRAGTRSGVHDPTDCPEQGPGERTGRVGRAQRRAPRIARGAGPPRRSGGGRLAPGRAATAARPAAATAAGRTRTRAPAACVAPQALVALDARRGTHIGEQLGTHGIGRDVVPDVLLDLAERKGIGLAGKAYGVATCAGPGRATDAMHVVFGVLGQIEVEYVTDIVDVQTAGGHVGGHQDRQLADW